MKRTSIHLPEPMMQRLKVVSDKVDLPVSEIIRAAIESYLKVFTEIGGKRD